MWRTMGGNSDENESMASFSFPDFLFPNSQDPGNFFISSFLGNRFGNPR
jgi:hypothetical protein